MPNPADHGSNEPGAFAARVLAVLDGWASLHAPPRLTVAFSGGLDSTAVAALAAARPAAGRLATFSYVFGELTSVDERRWIEAIARRWNLDATCFAGDGFWPLRGGEVGPEVRAAPFFHVYWVLRNRVLELARMLGDAESETAIKHARAMLAEK